MSSARPKRKVTARAKASANSLDLGSTRVVKENRSNENKIHLVLEPLSTTGENENILAADQSDASFIQGIENIPSPPGNKVLGKRKRSITPSKKRKQAKFDEEPTSADEEFELEAVTAVSDEYVSDVSEEDLGLSSDEEIKLTRKKNKKLTRRQKAMNAPIISNGLMALPMENEKKPMTEEAKNRKSEQARRRKRLAERQAEEEKRAVIEKLLNKSKSKKEDKNEALQGLSRQPLDPDTCFSYHQKLSKEGPTSVLIFPKDVIPQFNGFLKPPQKPTTILCGAAGCKNQKKYNCSKTKTPLCSLGCYQSLQAN